MLAGHFSASSSRQRHYGGFPPLAQGASAVGWDESEDKQKRRGWFLRNSRKLAMAALCAVLGLCALGLAFRAASNKGPGEQAEARVQADGGLGDHGGSSPAGGPAAVSSRKLLLATHTRLLWFDCDTKQTTVLHEGKGIYYGHFPGAETDERGDATTVWVISRPHNWKPETADEFLLHLDLRTGEEIGRVKVPSRFSHDAVRIGDKVFIASTGDGNLIEMSFPSMRLEGTHSLFTLKQHVNTLSPVFLPSGGSAPATRLWAMLHRKGPSQIVQVDLSGGQARLTGETLEEVGSMSHGLVHWRGGLLVLDSQRAGLLFVGTPDAAAGERTLLWQSDLEPRPFLKGLAVVDDIAYIGVSAPSKRSQRNDPSLDSQVAAVDLIAQRLLWIADVPTHGLLNAISAPHLSSSSSYRAAYTTASKRAEARAAEARARAERSSARPAVGTADGLGINQAYLKAFGLEQNEEPGFELNALRDQALKELNSGRQPVVESETPGGRVYVDESKMLKREAEMEKGPDMVWEKLLSAPESAMFVGGHWASGLPYMDLSKKVQGLHSAAAFLPLTHLDSSKLRDAVLAEPFEAWTADGQKRLNAWLDGRADNMEAIKPGVTSIHLIFSDGKIKKDEPVGAYEFPFYRKYAELLEPMLDAVLGENKRNIIRLQLARMATGSLINHHKDDGSWVKRAHRIHVPLATGTGADFHMCGREPDNTTSVGECSRLVYGEGDVFEINNKRLHYVRNYWENPRIHLVIDVVEQDVFRHELAIGQVCDYTKKIIQC